MKRLMQTLGVIGAVPAATLAWTTPARAATLEINYGVEIGSTNMPAPVVVGSFSNRIDHWGIGAFEDDGDRFRVQDVKADGERVALHWRLADGSRRGLCVNTRGAGHIVQCDKDLPERKALQIRLGKCSGDGSSCTSLADYNSWTGWANTAA